MADVITRFKLETTQYDSKLRDASKGLAEYSRQAALAGKEFQKFTKGNVDAARAFGRITTSATNAKDKVKELVGAFNDVARAYNSLTKEQQQSDFGKALAESMQQLKGRIREAKQELYGLGNAMKGAQGGSTAGGGGSAFGGMMQVFGGNMLTKATGLMTDMGAKMLEISNRAVEMSVNAEGVRAAFERLNRPGLLDNLREATHGTVSDLELMKQAVKFNDFNLDVEQLGAFLAFAQQKAKDTGESVDFLVNSIVTGLGRKSLMILDNLGLSANEIKEKMKETGDMTTAVAAIIQERMKESGDYMETAFDRGKRAEVDLENATLNLGNALRQTFGFDGVNEMSNIMETRLINDFTQLIQSVDILTSKLSSMGIEGNRALTALSDLAFGLMAGPLGSFMALTGNSFKNYAVNGGTGATGGHIIKRNNPGGGGGGGTITPRGGRGGGGSQELDVMAANNKMITELSKQAITATDEERMAIREKIKALQDQNKEYQYYIDLVTGKIKQQEPIESGQGVGLGTVDNISKELSKPLDVSAIKTPLQSLEEELKNLIELQKLAWSPDQFQAYQAMIENVQGKIGDFKGINKDGKETAKSWQGAASAISSVGSAMSQIEDPAAKVMGTIAQAIATIALTYAKSLEGTFTPWDWIAGAAAGLAQMTAVISAIHSTTGYAQGGMIKGNSYSGDNIGGLVDGSQFVGLNAGEVVLNASQQSMLAQNLQGSGGGGVHVAGILRGEDIVLVADRWGRRTGKGELLFGKNL